MHLDNTESLFSSGHSLNGSLNNSFNNFNSGVHLPTVPFPKDSVGIPMIWNSDITAAAKHSNGQVAGNGSADHK